jgi:hypothetical protein
MAAKHEITRADIMPMTAFAKMRDDRRQTIRKIKRHRRFEIGPFATIYFENYDTMWWQVHEMLYIEQGGEDQIADELRAYNSLVPNGAELVCTLMFEIDQKERRQQVLAGLGGVEHTVSLKFADETITAAPEDDVERSSAGGRTSSVHFLHFPFTGGTAAKFCAPGTRVVLSIGHPGYSHMAVMPEDVRTALANDFD